MYGKSNMETYITTCKIGSQQEFAVWFRKLKQGLCIKLEGWMMEGDGRGFQKGGDICIPMVFPVVMYRCESWTVKKAEHQRIYLQVNSGETDIENRLMDMGRREERVRCMKE